MKTIAALTIASLVAVSAALAAGYVLHGSFEVRIGGRSPAILDASWVVTFSPRHRYSIARNDTIVVRGTDTITANRVTFGHETGSMACTGSQASATYSWKLKSGKLTLKPISEKCAGRRIVLSTKPLTNLGG